ncbi:MAG: putative ABC exporter domain-containing protein, partial [Myxococcaceae bacterium]
MNLYRAWWLLIVAGWRNRILRQFRRLKNPRYAVASFVGAAYFFWVFVLQRRTSSRGPNISADVLPMIELLLVGFGAVGILLAWIFGNERATLAFTEAEVQFFFPAPSTRRGLLQFKLLRSLVRTLFSAGISALFFARNSNHPWFFAAGAFFGLATLNLHVTVASFFRDSLFQRGVSSSSRRIIPVVVFVAIAGFAVWAAWTKSPKPEWTDEITISNWASAFLDTRPLSWVLWPIRAPIHVALAQNGHDFLRALPAAVAMLVIHYVWLLSTDVSFEEGAIESAEKRTRWVESRRTGAPRPASPGKKTASWKLKTTGPTEWAIIWKNLIAARRVFSLRVLPTLLILAGVLAATSLVVLPGKGSGNLFALGFFCGVAALLLVIIGPASARIDLRHDLPQMDILRAWPLTGAQVMRGEIAGAALVLASLEWLMLVAAYGFTAHWHNEHVGHTEK